MKAWTKAAAKLLESKEIEEIDKEEWQGLINKRLETGVEKDKRVISGPSLGILYALMPLIGL